VVDSEAVAEPRQGGREGAPRHRALARRVGARVLVCGGHMVDDGGAAAIELERARHPSVADEHVQLQPTLRKGTGAVALAAVAPVEAGATQEVLGLALQPHGRRHIHQSVVQNNQIFVLHKDIEGNKPSTAYRFGGCDIIP